MLGDEIAQPRVNVLISTYNGERYIEEQLQSVLAQTYENIVIHIRDDGSSDRTRGILEQYKDNPRIDLFWGEQLGYGKSFLTLLEQADEGDYWAYCDQDDVWLPEKIETAIHWMSKQDSTKPCLFHSAYYNTDESLNPFEIVEKPTYRFDFPRAITECIYLGFSEVMNAPLRSLVLKGDKSNLVTHDWWTELIAIKYGNVEYDNRPMTYHRRLDDSVSGGAMKQRLCWLKRAWKGNAEIRSCTQEFERVFGYHTDDRDSIVNHWFCGEEYSISKAFHKAFYPCRWRASISSELVVRILMLCGRI